MPRRLTELTAEQRDRMASFAQEWIAWGRRTTPLSEQEWRVWERGAQRCYEFAQIPWPDTVIRVSSPMVGALAAPLAAKTIALYRPLLGQEEAPGRSVHSAVDSAVHSAVHSAVGSAVRSAVEGAVYSAVRSAVDSAVDSAVYSAVDSAVYSAVDSAVRSAVEGAVEGAVDSAVDSAVRSAVYSAVGSAVGSADLRLFWHYWLGGRLWAYWPSFVAYFRDEIQLQLDNEIWERSRAYEDLLSAGYCWTNRDFVMVCDTPSVLHLETAGGQHRLHCETGPAVAWADGWGVYSWHGVTVPADLIEGSWDASRIMAETNTEVRRCAIEKMGWDRFVKAAELALVDEHPDPGNTDQVLRLYDVPRTVIDLPVRVLVATNGSIERDGTRRQFGLTVPTDCRTALAAAAWTYDLTEKEYAATQVRR